MFADEPLGAVEEQRGAVKRSARALDGAHHDEYPGLAGGLRDQRGFGPGDVDGRFKIALESGPSFPGSLAHDRAEARPLRVETQIRFWKNQKLRAVTARARNMVGSFLSRGHRVERHGSQLGDACHKGLHAFVPKRASPLSLSLFFKRLQPPGRPAAIMHRRLTQGEIRCVPKPMTFWAI